MVGEEEARWLREVTFSIAPAEAKAERFAWLSHSLFSVARRA